MVISSLYFFSHATNAVTPFTLALPGGSSPCSSPMRPPRLVACPEDFFWPHYRPHAPLGPILSLMALDNCRPDSRLCSTCGIYACAICGSNRIPWGQPSALTFPVGVYPTGCSRRRIPTGARGSLTIRFHGGQHGQGFVRTP